MNLAEFLAGNLKVPARTMVDLEDGVTVAAAFELAWSLLMHLGQDVHAQRLREVGQALGLNRFGEQLGPEMNQLATILLQAESKRRAGA